MLRKFLAVIPLALCVAIPPYGQSAFPSDNVTVQLNNTWRWQNNGHLQMQHYVNGQGVDQSQESLIRFNLSSLPAGLTPANIQTASLTLFVDGGGTPGTITVCELAATPLMEFEEYNRGDDASL